MWMKNTVGAFAILTALAACDNATSDQKNQTLVEATSATEQSETDRINAFFAQAIKERIALSPQFAHRLGDKSRQDEWDDRSEAATDANLALAKAHLATLETFDMRALSPERQLSYRLFKMLGERTVNRDKWRYHTYPANQMYGIHTGTATFLINVHRIGEVGDAEAYIKRLTGIKTVMDQAVTGLQTRAEKGIIAPKFVFPLVITAAENIISGAPFDDSETDSPLYADFKKKVGKLDVSDAEKEALITSAKEAMLASVKPGYDLLLAELKRQEGLATTDDGVWKLPDGEEFYQAQLKYHTTTNLTPEQIHQIGLDNVARIHGQMKGIMAQVGFEGSLPEFFDFTRTGDQFFFPNTEEGKADYLKLAETYIANVNKKAPEYFSLMPKAPLEVRAVEKFREKSAGKAFYQRPSLDGSRPGYFYANLRDMKIMPIYQLEALAIHEGVPGHHFQIALAQELEGVPLFQKVTGFTAFSEGWGLYTEELGKDMGFYKDPYSDFGRLAMELWRACRLVVDSGLHSKKWTREQAIDYLVENTPNPRGDSEAAIERYIVMPGQATAYLVGKLKIMELRGKAMEQLGDKFDWRGFHQTVLENGFVPLNILEENVDKWIASVKAQG